MSAEVAAAMSTAMAAAKWLSTVVALATYKRER